MRRKILLPTDFSDNSWNALVYALKLFKDEYCTFYFLHATTIKVPTLSNLSNKLLSAMKEESNKELLAFKAFAESSDANANHDFHITSSTQDLLSAIWTAIEEKDIDLVIMGTKGATGAKEFFIGSNSMDVVKKIKKCPVLIVPEEYDFVAPKQIAFPTDYNRKYDLKEINPLRQLADLFDSKIRILHINVEDELSDVQDTNLTNLLNHLQDYESSLHWMPNYDKKSQEINDFIDEMKIDILAMVNHDHNIIEKMIKEPVIEKIGFHPKIPFLVIPE